MITKISNWLPAGLLVLVLWQGAAEAQQGAWDRHIDAGFTAYQQGKYDEAVTQTRLALEAAQAFGPDDPRLATTLNNLAAIYRAEGKYAEAELLQKRALANWERTLGPEHQQVATGLSNLAGLYMAQGRYAEAGPLEQRALAIRFKALGPEHPQVATGLENYAGLLRKTGRTAEADDLAARAEAIRTKRAN
jgi:tetratricopeptide (TPR) repeat protein